MERLGEAGHTACRPSANHTFLKLQQPMSENLYPSPRLFKKGHPYRFPFTFVVPDQLLPQSCRHAAPNMHLQAAHTQLPPSMGDPMLTGDGTNLLDDMAPQMSRVSYIIRVSISKKGTGAGARPKVLLAVAKKVRIIPAMDEQPPLEFLDNSDDYCGRREKNIRKGFLRRKLGRLVVAAPQSKPLQLPPPNTSSPGEASTAVTVHLRFDPEGNEPPPKLRTLWSKVKVLTFFSTTPWEDFPSKSPGLTWNQNRGFYTKTVPLSSMCVASARWEKHPMAKRRISLQSDSSEDTVMGSSASYAGSVFYTASIIVPITLPPGKAFVPTFHSCLISRIYALELCVSYQTPNANALASSVTLKIPLQVTSAYRKGSIESPVDDAMDHEFFRPRITTPPSGDFEHAVLAHSTGSLGHMAAPVVSDNANSLEPPEYSLLSPLTRPIEYQNGESLFPGLSLPFVPAERGVRTAG